MLGVLSIDSTQLGDLISLPTPGHEIGSERFRMQFLTVSLENSVRSAVAQDLRKWLLLLRRPLDEPLSS